MNVMRPNHEDNTWAALHRGTEREGLDSPARYELDRITALPSSRSTRRTDPPQAAAHAGPPVGPKRTLVRPYARTGGRTRPEHDLALESLVSTTDHGRRYLGAAPRSHRLICELCAESRSVAEIAAQLHLPLGVVKVLVGDLAAAGHVQIHQTGLVIGDRSSRDFMERVLQGLRAL
jgi:hypothetical protein